MCAARCRRRGTPDPRHPQPSLARAGTWLRCPYERPRSTSRPHAHARRRPRGDHGVHPPPEPLDRGDAAEAPSSVATEAPSTAPGDEATVDPDDYSDVFAERDEFFRAQQLPMDGTPLVAVTPAQKDFIAQQRAYVEQQGLSWTASDENLALALAGDACETSILSRHRVDASTLIAHVTTSPLFAQLIPADLEGDARTTAEARSRASWCSARRSCAPKTATSGWPPIARCTGADRAFRCSVARTLTCGHDPLVLSALGIVSAGVLGLAGCASNGLDARPRTHGDGTPGRPSRCRRHGSEGAGRVRVVLRAAELSRGRDEPPDADHGGPGRLRRRTTRDVHRARLGVERGRADDRAESGVRGMRGRDPQRACGGRGAPASPCRVLGAVRVPHRSRGDRGSETRRRGGLLRDPRIGHRSPLPR